MVASFPVGSVAADTVVYEPAGKFPQLPGHDPLGRCSAVAMQLQGGDLSLPSRQAPHYLCHAGRQISPQLG